MPCPGHAPRGKKHIPRDTRVDSNGPLREPMARHNCREHEGEGFSPLVDFCAVFRAVGAALRRDGNPHTHDRGIKPLLKEESDESFPRQLAVQKSAVGSVHRDFICSRWSSAKW